MLTHAYSVTYAHPDSLIPPRARHRDGQAARAHGARHSDQRSTGTAMIRPFSGALRYRARRGLWRRADARYGRPTPLTGQAPQGTPPAPSQQAPSFRAGVDVVSLNVTVTDGTARYVTDLRGRRLQRLRRRRQAGRDVVQPDEPADRARAAARHQRQHGNQAAGRAGSGRRLRAAPPAAGSRRNRRLRQPRRRPPALHATARPSSSRRSARPRPAAPRRCTTRSTSR